MQLTFESLADRPRDVPTVMAWWHEVWGERMGDLETYTASFRAALGGDALPLTLVALLDGELAGTAALKEHEMRELFPQYRYWMGSVYVRPELRGRGVASRLAGRVIELARERKLPQLYLQTLHPEGGLYAKMGWEPRDRLLYRGDQTLVMVRSLD